MVLIVHRIEQSTRSYYSNFFLHTYFTLDISMSTDIPRSFASHSCHGEIWTSFQSCLRLTSVVSLHPTRTIAVLYIKGIYWIRGITIKADNKSYPNRSDFSSHPVLILPSYKEWIVAAWVIQAQLNLALPRTTAKRRS